MNSKNSVNKPTIKEGVVQLIKSIKPYILKIWLHKTKIIAINVAVLIFTLLYLLFVIKPFYNSTITILPDYGNQASGLLGQFSGLASLAGVGVGDASYIQIYENLIYSEEVLGPVIYKKYQTEEFPDSVNLIEYFEIEPKNVPDSLAERSKFLQMLEAFGKARLKTDFERLTNILTFTVEMPEPKLTADVANKITRSLNNYILFQRKSFASEKRIYLQNRISVVKDSLSYLENEYKVFRETNRLINSSPELMLIDSRFFRELEIKNAVYVELMKQLELAKIEEVKNTPVVNVREKAGNPVEKSGPRRLIMLIFIMFMSFTGSTLYYMLKDDIKNIYKEIR